MKFYLAEMGYEAAEVAQDCVQWWTLALVEMNLLVLQPTY
jgi:hypothetical protein